MSEKTLKSRIASYFNINTNKKKESMRAYTEHIVKTVDKTMNYAMVNKSLPICMIDSEGKFLWYNKKFTDIYQNSEMLNEGIYKLTGLKPADFFTEDSSEKSTVINNNGKSFKALSSYSDENKNSNEIHYWIDIHSF